MTPVETLSLPRMLVARLVDAEFNPRPFETAEEIVSRGWLDVFLLRNIGRRKLLMVRDALSEKGLFLKIPRQLEPPHVKTDRERRLAEIARFNKQLRVRAKQRGL